MPNGGKWRPFWCVKSLSLPEYFVALEVADELESVLDQFTYFVFCLGYSWDVGRLYNVIQKRLQLFSWTTKTRGRRNSEASILCNQTIWVGEQSLHTWKQKKGDLRETSPFVLGSNPSVHKRLTTSATSKVKSYDVKEKDSDFLIEGWRNTR
jgi:hypothetical protein